MHKGGQQDKSSTHGYTVRYVCEGLGNMVYLKGMQIVVRCHQANKTLGILLVLGGVDSRCLGIQTVKKRQVRGA